MNLRDNARNRVFLEYDNKGLKSALEFSKSLLLSTERGADYREEKAVIKGELAEATLLCQLDTLQRTLKFKASIVRGLFVKDTYSEKVTELDITFITPFQIYLFECKSYSGKIKRVEVPCLLCRDDKYTTNVFDQNKLHLQLFNRRYGGFVEFNSKPYKIVVYDYATVLYDDVRPEEYKLNFPVLNETTLLTYMVSDLAKRSRSNPCVDYNKIMMHINRDLKAYDSVNEKAHRQQLNY